MDENKIKSLLETQKNLSQMISVSGFETEMRDYLLPRLKKHADKVWEDGLGSIYAELTGKSSDSNPQRILIDAHIDEVGLMLNHIDKNGFCRFVPIGGWDERILPGLLVEFINKEWEHVRGIIGTTPPHLTMDQDRKKSIPFDQLFIDFGFSSLEEAIQNRVEIGCIGVPYSTYEILNNKRLIGKSFDDRCGVNILIHLIEAFSSIENRPEKTLLFSFSVQEEVGLRGAGAVVYHTQPDMAIVIENTTAGDTPNIAEEKNPAILGQGPAITIADNGLIASIKINEKISQIAKDKDIPFQWKRPIFGGTNAGKIHTSLGGIPTTVISVPSRYIHSPLSMIHLEDLYHTYDLIYHFLRCPFIL